MRIELAGRGFPIPDLALPEPLISDDRPTQVLIFADGEVFNKVDWVNLGYTNYEVWCVGGAGGLGGTLNDGMWWPAVRTRPHMNSTEWGWYLEIMHYYNDPLGVHYSHWDPVLGMEVPITMDQYYEDQFPNHDPWYHARLLTPSLRAVGNPAPGAGGGGGVHVISGELDDLPDSVPVMVGAAGADAGPGQIQVNGSWTPDLEPQSSYASYPEYIRDNFIWSDNFMDRDYPLPHPSFLPPQPGGDGGASSFGDIAKASGGKGGGPAKVWVGASLVTRGHGGDGGLGGRLLAGGGGKGSITSYTSTAGVVTHDPGGDGSWDGVIGGGGGGGRGGEVIVTGSPPYSVTTIRQGSNGGRGAFSYGDTSVYGQRQYPSVFVSENRQYDYYTGALVSTTLVSGSHLLIPGGGGGVRANRKRLVGSDAQGYSPDGMVLLRLMKLD
jgi:hypothetical protein